MQLICALAVATMAVSASSPAVGQALDVGPRDPIATIVAAFRTHPIVALDELHGDERSHAFRLALIRDPRFAAVANDVVVEFGNSRYQSVIGRFAAGADVTPDELEKIWQDTTQAHMIWDRPIYEDFFRAVRAVNLRLPETRRLRILLGDPPIDWDAVRTSEDRQEALRLGRSAYPADLIMREVLARQRRALVIYGGMHLMRQNLQGPNLIEHLENKAGVRAFVVGTVADLAVIGADGAAWPSPSLALTRGSGLANQLDALLYLGPASGKRTSRLSPALCSDAGYRRMRIRRMTLAGMANAAELLDRECAAPQSKPDLSGTWKPVEAPDARPAPPSPSSGAPPPPQTLSITVSQSESELKVERRVETGGREAVYTFTYKLDRSTSVNQMGPLVFRTTAAWDGASLVLSSEVSADEKPLGRVKDVYRVENGELIVETTRETPAGMFTMKMLHRKQ